MQPDLDMQAALKNISELLADGMLSQACYRLELKKIIVSSGGGGSDDDDDDSDCSGASLPSLTNLDSYRHLSVPSSETTNSSNWQLEIKDKKFDATAIYQSLAQKMSAVTQAINGLATISAGMHRNARLQWAIDNVLLTTF